MSIGSECRQGWRFLAEQVPCVEVLVELGLAAAHGKVNVQAVSEDADGQNVPAFHRVDVGDEEVDLLGGVWAGAVPGNTNLVSRLLAPNRLHLDAPEEVAGVEDEVVVVAISPGLGDAEAERDGFTHESEFGHFSFALGKELEFRCILLKDNRTQF